jgi:outer membrane protein assembly factor BamB
MKYLAVFLTTCALLTLPLFAGAADWPQLHGPNRDRTSPDTGLNANWTANPPPQLWKVDLFGNGHGSGYAGPCVAGGTAYMVDRVGYNEVLRAIGLADGKERWRVSYLQKMFDFYGGSNCTPTFDNGRLYLEARDGQIICVDAAKQAIVWNVNLAKDLGGTAPPYGYNASVIVDGDNVIVQPGGPGHACAALNKLTGETIWVGGGDDIAGYTPVTAATFNGVKQYVCTGESSVFSVEAATGKRLWSIPSGLANNNSNATMPLVVGENRLFIAMSLSRPCAVYDITPDGPKQVWQNSNMLGGTNQPVLFNGALFGTGKQNGTQGELLCEDAATGKILWSQAGFVDANLIAVDGKLIVEDGNTGEVTLVKLTTDGYHALGKISGLGQKNQNYTPPVEADGVLLLRNFNTLAAYKLRADSADWPQYHGPNGDRTSPETGLNKDWNTTPPPQVWNVALTDGGYAGPAVAGGTLFIVDHQGPDDIVRALNLTTGAERWRTSYADKGQGGYGATQCTPTVYDGKVYTISRAGKVLCLQANDGTLVWQRELAKELGGSAPAWGYAMSAMIDGDWVVVQPGGRGKAMATLNRLTGDTVWVGGGDDIAGYATPIVATLNATKQYVGYGQTTVFGVDAATGRQLWSVPWSTGPNANNPKADAPTPVNIGGTIFVTCGYDSGCALLDVTPQGAKIRWQNKEMMSAFNTPVLVDGVIYGTSDPGRLIALDPVMGKVKWSTPGFQKGGLLAVDGTLIVMDGSNGSIAMVQTATDGYHELGRMAGLGGESWTAPILADGMLVVRNKTTLAAYKLK